MDLKQYEALIPHLFLCRKLPGSTVRATLLEAERNILQLVLNVIQSFAQTTPSNSILNSQLQRLEYTVRVLSALNSSDAETHLDPDRLQKAIHDLPVGQSVALYIRE